MLGSIVDSRYELVRLLGTGGMGAVYEALHLGTGRRVAVKLIARADLADDDEIVVRFQREAKVAAHIDTPHIVNIIDAGRDRASSLPFIAMDLLEGYDVKQLVARFGALPSDLALRIGAQACAGLKKAHEAGVVHRDIKPANIFLARGAGGRVTVKLLDFGIAKLPVDLLSSIEGAGVTTTGKLLGSPLFMSPEQAKGLKTLDHRTDLWSLGAVLYEALAGRPPFSNCSTVGQLIVAICSQPPEDLEQSAPWTLPGAGDIVRKAMTIDVDRRYATAEGMLEDLMRLLPGGPAIDESMLVGMSNTGSPSPSPGASPRQKTAIVGSASHGATAGDLWAPGLADPRGSQPTKPVTVSLARQPALAGGTLRSSDHDSSPEQVESGRASSGRARPGARRARAIAWGASLSVAVVLVGWGARWLLSSGAGSSPTIVRASEAPIATPAAAAAGASTESAPTAVAPAAETSAVPIALESKGARVAPAPDGARAASRQSGASALSHSSSGVSGAARNATAKPVGPAGVQAGLLGAAPAASAAPASGSETTAGATIEKPPHDGGAPARGSKFNTLNPNFE